MFLTRVLSGIALVIILGLTIYLGGYFLWVLLLFISIVGVNEYSRAVGVHDTGAPAASKGEKVPFNALELSSYVFAVLYYSALLFSKNSDSVLLLPFFVCIISIVSKMVLFVLRYPRIEVTSVMKASFGEIYVPVMLGFLYLLRQESEGIQLILLVFVTSWVSDTFAYLVGRTIGRHKLSPVLSPKKSIEGAVGGVAGAVLLGFILSHFMESGPWVIALISGIGAVISQCGDLFASGIKRHYGIKDYGNLIPGHGGILDRFDSVIITAPIIFILFYIVKKGGL